MTLTSDQIRAWSEQLCALPPIDFQGALEAFDGLVMAAVVAVEQAEVVVGIGVVWSQRQRPGVALDGLLKAADVFQRGSQIVPNFGIVGAQGGRPPQRLDGVAQASGLPERRAQKQMRLRLAGIEGDGLLIELDGGGETGRGIFRAAGGGKCKIPDCRSTAGGASGRRSRHSR